MPEFKDRQGKDIRKGHIIRIEHGVCYRHLHYCVVGRLNKDGTRRLIDSRGPGYSTDTLEDIYSIPVLRKTVTIVGHIHKDKDSAFWKRLVAYGLEAIVPDTKI